MLLKASMLNVLWKWHSKDISDFRFRIAELNECGFLIADCGIRIENIKQMG